jgi:hypothetical protein
VSAGETPLVGGTVSREYWLRPSLPRAFCGGRPPLRGAGAGLRSEVGTSGGAGSETVGAMAGSVLGIGSGVGSRASFSVRCQLVLEAVWAASVPSPFLRSARPLRLFAASLRSLSRSFSRCSFWCWLRAAAPRGFCLGAEALVLSSSDSRTGEPLGEREPVRCRLISDLILRQSCQLPCLRRCNVASATHSSLSSRLRFLRVPFSEGTGPSCLLSSMTFLNTSSSS